jgi:hypothetical protein
MRPVTYSWLAVVLGIACAAIGWLGLAGWLAVLVLLASVGVHVAGNAIGTRLREATDRDLARVSRPRPLPALPPQRPPAQLQQHTSLGSLVPVSALVGGLCGFTAGSVALYWLASSSVAGAVLGGLSSAVLGALFGFLITSFVEILRTSLREAIAAERASTEQR